VNDGERYRIALLDWLGCATAGGEEPPARAARAAGDGLLDRVTAAGCAGHVLDYDDTYTPGLVHASAPVAPAVLLLGAELGRDLETVLDAFAAGWEATAALARAGHPALYERGWHPTAVCGTVGAAIASSRLLDLDRDAARSAAALALLRAGGLRAAFGSPGKALQVGGAAAAGLQAARLVAGGARAPLDTVAHGPAGYEHAFGGRWAEPDGPPAVRENWIKAYPCCLGTHSPIEAAVALRERGRPDGPITVVVHPVARQAATHDDATDGLQAKFSIPYLVAFALLHGAPGAGDFAAVDDSARTLARESITVALDPRLGEMEARIDAHGETLARVETALGSPARPMDADELAAKLHGLAGGRLDGALDDLTAPAAAVVAAGGLA
jgi:2-methylcitrate dehydratase PrpD